MVIQPLTDKLPPELIDYINHWRDKPGNLIMVLHRVQKTYGYIPRQIALQITALLDVPLAKIYGVITFYHFFKEKKPGAHLIAVCMGTACYLKGGEDLLKELQTLLGIEVGGTTKDGAFTLEAVRCIGCCGLAPVIMIDEEVIGHLKKEDLPTILARYKKEITPATS